jgi:hypothetical protein
MEPGAIVTTVAAAAVAIALILALVAATVRRVGEDERSFPGPPALT